VLRAEVPNAIIWPLVLASAARTLCVPKSRPSSRSWVGMNATTPFLGWRSSGTIDDSEKVEMGSILHRWIRQNVNPGFQD
jgi:hypothetical protein